MAEETGQTPEPQPEPDRCPRPSRIADAPASAEACVADFGSGAPARAWAQKQPKHRL